MTIYDYIWLLMTTTLHDYVYLCMTLYNHIWLCVTIYVFIQLCIARYVYLNLCMTLYHWWSWMSHESGLWPPKVSLDFITNIHTITPYIFVFLSIILCDSEWLSMVLYDYTWLYTTLYDSACIMIQYDLCMTL